MVDLGNSGLSKGKYLRILFTSKGERECEIDRQITTWITAVLLVLSRLVIVNWELSHHMRLLV